MIITDPLLSVKDIYKSFGDIKALRGVSFDLSEGEIVAVLGPSGCGKSTLLAVIAGLVSPDFGEINWEGKSLENVPPHKRGFGLMFQDFALFPHMNVQENVSFGLRFRKIETKRFDDRISQVLDLVGLSGFEKRDINTLSGGEKQRVALARSIAPQPRLLMLDEPLGSLDRNLRERLIFELREILSSMKQTAIYVTHDQEEAFSIADRAVLMRAGQVEQIGTPYNIYNHPNSPFAARFLEFTNLFPGTVLKLENSTMVSTEIGSFPINDQYQGKVIVLIRSDRAGLDAQSEVTLKGKLLDKSFRGNIQRAIVVVNDKKLKFDFSSTTQLPDQGDDISINIDPQTAIQIFQDHKS